MIVDKIQIFEELSELLYSQMNNIAPGVTEDSYVYEVIERSHSTLISFAALVENSFQVEVPLNIASGWGTISDVVEYIVNHYKRRF
jgi:acyl carrier protein